MIGKKWIPEGQKWQKITREAQSPDPSWAAG
jgi:hypothetical protein